MSAIARYYKFKGYEVSGYDKTPSELTARLEAEGIVIHYEDNTDFIPKDSVYFRDGYLHPNDKGFEVYASSLADELKKVLPGLFAK